MEKKISFLSREHTIRGWAHVPEIQGKAPVVIICHGFTGNCSEHGLFEYFAKQACEAGFYVLRIDCVGSGPSDGDFAEYTYLGGWRDDIMAALDFAAEQPETDSKRMAAMGISMGAAAALLTLADKRVRTAVGWAPVLYPAEVFHKILGDANWAKLENGEKIHHEYAKVKFDVLPRFLQDVKQLSVEQAIREGGKPALLCLGTADLVINPGFGSRMEALTLPQVIVRMVEDENHGFQVRKQENVEVTIDFLRSQLMNK